MLLGVIPVEMVLPISLIAMAGEFASAIRAPLTGVLLIAEITQLSSLLLPIGIVVLVSHLVAELLGVKPFYAALQERLAPDKNYCEIQTGMDAFKALALGADGVCIGRPLMTAIKQGGKDGVRDYLLKANAELRKAMAFTGCMTLAEMDPTVIHRL